jgi:hypothetical protein
MLINGYDFTNGSLVFANTAGKYYYGKTVYCSDAGGLRRSNLCTLDKWFRTLVSNILRLFGYFTI